MKVVFAGWAPATADGKKGVEFEVWAGGIRAIKIKNDGDKRGNETEDKDTKI